MTNCAWLSAAALDKSHIEAFLNHLAVNKSVSAATQAQAPNALVFLYKHVLHQEVGEMDDLRSSKRFKNIPTVLRREEMKTLLAGMQGHPAIMAGLRYAAGLRVNECVTLHLQDLDLAQHLLSITSRHYARAVRWILYRVIEGRATGPNFPAKTWCTPALRRL